MAFFFKESGELIPGPSVVGTSQYVPYIITCKLPFASPYTDDHIKIEGFGIFLLHEFPL